MCCLSRSKERWGRGAGIGFRFYWCRLDSLSRHPFHSSAGPDSVLGLLDAQRLRTCCENVLVHIHTEYAKDNNNERFPPILILFVDWSWSWSFFCLFVFNYWINSGHLSHEIWESALQFPCYLIQNLLQFLWLCGVQNEEDSKGGINNQTNQDLLSKSEPELNSCFHKEFGFCPLTGRMQRGSPSDCYFMGFRTRSSLSGLWNLWQGQEESEEAPQETHIDFIRGVGERRIRDSPSHPLD